MIRSFALGRGALLGAVCLSASAVCAAEPVRLGGLFDDRPQNIHYDSPSFAGFQTPLHYQVGGVPSSGFAESRAIAGESDMRVVGVGDMLGLRTITAVHQSVSAGSWQTISTVRAVNGGGQADFAIVFSHADPNEGIWDIADSISGADVKFPEPVRFFLVDVPLSRPGDSRVYMLAYFAPVDPPDSDFSGAVLVGFDPGDPDNTYCEFVDPGILPPASLFMASRFGGGDTGEWDFETQGRFLALANELVFTVPTHQGSAIYTGRFSADPETVLFRYTMTLLFGPGDPMPDFGFESGRDVAVQNTVMTGFDMDGNVAPIAVSEVQQIETTSAGESFLVFTTPSDDPLPAQMPTLGRLSDALRISNPAPVVDLSKGDVNDDGVVDATDSTPFVHFLTQRGVTPLGAMFDQADMDSSGQVNEIDLRLIRARIALALDERKAGRGVDGDPDFANPAFGFVLLQQGDPVPGFPDRGVFNPRSVRVLDDGSAIAFLSSAVGPGGFADQIHLLWKWEPDTGLEVLASTQDDFGDGAIGALGFRELGEPSGLNRVALVAELQSGQFAIYEFEIKAPPDLPPDIWAVN